MSHSHNLNPIIGEPIDNLKRKPLEQIPAGAMHKQREAFRRSRGGFDPMVKFSKK
jgi:hypothetical protein